MTEKVFPAPQEGGGNSNNNNKNRDETDLENPGSVVGRARGKSGTFVSDASKGVEKVLTEKVKKKARNRAESIFTVSDSMLERTKSATKAKGARRHTMINVKTSQSMKPVRLDDASGKGKGGEVSESDVSNRYFDLKKTAGKAGNDIQKDLGELDLIVEALDMEEQSNLKEHMKSALTRVTDNLKHLTFLQDRADHLSLKLVRASNWAHSKEVRKKRVTIMKGVNFGGGAHGEDHSESLFGKVSSSTVLATFCITILVCMLVNSGHPVRYSEFEHVESISLGSPYLVPLNNNPLDVVEVSLHKDSHAHDTGYVLVDLYQKINTSTGVTRPRIGRQMGVNLSSKQLHTFHLRFFPKRDEKFLDNRELVVNITGPYDSNLDSVVLKTHVMQHGHLGLFQEYIAMVVLLLVLGIIALEWLDRTLSAMIGASLMIGLLVCLNKTPDLKTIISWCDEGTLGLLFGMMVIVNKLSLTGFMDLMTYKLIPLCKGSKYRLLYILCALTAVMSAFLDNVTTVLLVAPLTVTLSKSLKINPLPFLTGEVLFSNIGGTATMIGDPPNVIVGSRLADDLTFTDFMISLGPAVILMSVPCMLVVVHYYRRELAGPLTNVEEVLKKSGGGIRDPELFSHCMIVLAMVLFGFLLHPVHHVNPAWIAISGAIMLLLFSSPHDIEPALESVEWSTLLFFASLFVMVEAMAEVGLISTIGTGISNLIESVDEDNRLLVALVLVIWISALVSAFLDNIPYTATMVPIIVQLASNDELGLDIKPLAWALCFGACLGGNGSLMGASANIVVAGIADKSGFPLTFKSFFSIGFRVLLVSVTLSTGYMLLIYCV